MTVGKLELNTASKVANKVARQWERVEVEDLYSSLLLWIYTHYKRVQAGDPVTYPGRLYSELKREAIRYCAKEAAQNIGQPINLDRAYTINRVRRALPYIFEDLPTGQVAVDPNTGRAVGQTNRSDVMELLIDLKTAFMRLSKADREIIRLKHRDGLSWSEVAEIVGISSDSLRKRMERAIIKLVRELSSDDQQPNY